MKEVSQVWTVRLSIEPKRKQLKLESKSPPMTSTGSLQTPGGYCFTVEPYSHQRQFKFLDIDSKGKLTEASLLKWLSTMRKEYGKTWKNEDIDNTTAVKYYIRYFDINGDGEIDEEEFVKVMSRDEAAMEQDEIEGERPKKGSWARLDP
ncbi:EF hand [Cooperia oncophora]